MSLLCFPSSRFSSPVSLASSSFSPQFFPSLCFSLRRFSFSSPVTFSIPLSISLFIFCTASSSKCLPFLSPSPSSTFYRKLPIKHMLNKHIAVAYSASPTQSSSTERTPPVSPYLQQSSLLSEPGTDGTKAPFIIYT